MTQSYRLLNPVLFLMAILPAMHGAGALRAQEWEYGVAAKMGSLGVGAEVAIALNDYFDFRGGLQFLPLDLEYTLDDITYTLSLPSRNALVAVDLFPLGPSNRVLKLTGGFAFMMKDMKLKSVMTASTEIGDRVYTPLEIGKLEGQIKNSDFAPYVGVGLGSGVGELFGFYLDVGVALRNPPEVTLSADGTLRKDPVFQENLDRERRKIQEDAEALRYFPVIAVGFRIRH